MLAFFFCAFHCDISAHILSLESYIDASSGYIIGMETSTDTHSEFEGQHLHICADMSEKQYDSFRKTYLVKKLGLSGQASKGRSRQYGKVRNIRDETKMLQYTVKDQNIYYRNYDLKIIQQLIQDSFRKKDKKDFITELMEYLQTCMFYSVMEPDKLEIHQIEITIIKYYMLQRVMKPLSKSQIKSLTTKYLMYFHKNAFDLEKLYYYIML